MRKNNLTTNKGLSLSQAQSISNLCYQRAKNIESTLSGINNYSKSVKIDDVNQTIFNGKKIPDNIVELILEKSHLHACQAFLMENIKAKSSQLKQLKSMIPIVTDVKFPPIVKHLTPQLLEKVDEEWGWEQLKVNDINGFIEAEAYASHIGQFIHKNSPLDNLRNELPKIPAIEWMEINMVKKTPVFILTHHTQSELLEIHEKLAQKHRKFEQVVNYYNAKVKNLVTAENARIAKLNADAQNEANSANEILEAEYIAAYNIANNKVKSIKADFEKLRQEEISKVASYRIDVDPRFQKVIEKFLEQTKE